MNVRRWSEWQPVKDRTVETHSALGVAQSQTHWPVSRVKGSWFAIARPGWSWTRSFMNGCAKDEIRPDAVPAALWKPVRPALFLVGAPLLSSTGPDS